VARLSTDELCGVRHVTQAIKAAQRFPVIFIRNSEGSVGLRTAEKAPFANDRARDSHARIATSLATKLTHFQRS
jgi:hypothetical protein